MRSRSRKNYSFFFKFLGVDKAINCGIIDFSSIPVFHGKGHLNIREIFRDFLVGVMTKNSEYFIVEELYHTILYICTLM